MRAPSVCRSLDLNVGCRLISQYAPDFKNPKKIKGVQLADRELNDKTACVFLDTCRKPPRWENACMHAYNVYSSPGRFGAGCPGRHAPLEVDIETGLMFVTGKRAKQALKERAFEFVLRYTCDNDFLARDRRIPSKSNGLGVTYLVLMFPLYRSRMR